MVSQLQLLSTRGGPAYLFFIVAQLYFTIINLQCGSPTVCMFSQIQHVDSLPVLDAPLSLESWTTTMHVNRRSREALRHVWARSISCGSSRHCLHSRQASSQGPCDKKRREGQSNISTHSGRTHGKCDFVFIFQGWPFRCDDGLVFVCSQVVGHNSHQRATLQSMCLLPLPQPL